jgi:hypothetical protein
MEQIPSPFCSARAMTRWMPHDLSRATAPSGSSNLLGCNRIGRVPARGWSRHRRIILLRRKLARGVAMTDRADSKQPPPGFVKVGLDKELWEYAALVTSLDEEILTLGQLHRIESTQKTN